MVEDDEGDYVLYVDLMDMRAAMLSRHMLLMENTREHTKRGETTMKQFRIENGVLIEDENGGFVRWLDHASALFRQGQHHVEHLVIFNDEMDKLRLEICQKSLKVDIDAEVERLRDECERRFDIIEQKNQDIVERDKKIEQRSKTIETQKQTIISRCKTIEQRDKMIETQIQDNIRLEKIIESYRQDIAILREF